jgi:hypothetical protein
LFTGASSFGVANSSSIIIEYPQKQLLPCSSPPKKIKFAAESEETKNLTNGELQRLVLLEQLKLIRLQQEQIKSNLILIDGSNVIL